MGTANPASVDAPPGPCAMPLVVIPKWTLCKPTSGPRVPLLTAAVNRNSLNPCPAPGMSSASRRAAMVPSAALQARPVELGCGIHGGNPLSRPGWINGKRQAGYICRAGFPSRKLVTLDNLAARGVGARSRVRSEHSGFHGSV